MFDINTNNADQFDFALSDGTPVTFVKITSKDRIQVRVPDDHPLAGQDDGGADPTLRIFNRDGSHFKDRTSLTLSATPKASAADPAPTAAAQKTVYFVGGGEYANLDDALASADDGDEIFEAVSLGVVSLKPVLIGA